MNNTNGLHLPKLTIIVPSFNQGKYIKETLDSIISQNYPDLELIVMDGGSTDNTVEILRSYQEHITYWVSEKDRGQSHAINKALEIATGDYIGWQNSDDLYLPGALHTLAKKAMKGYDVVYGSLIGIDAASKEITRIYFVPFSPMALRYYGMAFSNQAALYKASLLKELKINENLHYAMDFDLEIRLSQATRKFGFVRGFWGAMRFHADAKTVKEFYGQSKMEEARIRNANGIKTDPAKPISHQYPLRWVLSLIYIGWYRFWFGGFRYRMAKIIRNSEPEIFNKK